jgi:FOG: CBS domain
MNPDMSIERIMRTDFPRLAPETPIREAVAVFARRRVPAAPVIDEALGLVGILTEKDCFRPMLNASYYQQWDGSVGDYMSREVLTLPVDLDFVSAAEEFLARSHRVYPVMRDETVVGLLLRSDLFAAILAASENGGGAPPAESDLSD